jgi:hypothetical protein
MKKTLKQGAYQYANITNKNLLFCYLLLAACASGSSKNSNTVELENKGTVMGVSTPDWVKIYVEKGLSALQAQPQYKDKYCIVGEESSAQYRQEINNTLNSLVNVSYSGAQREADWWSLRRRYDPANKEQYTDEYTAYVLYTVPKAERKLTCQMNIV